ncbi:PREDICTED: uncharacterized protein LOC105359541 [Ceratosolen solmsi marchali]|uniref:Uncharacterized protein LOC105359541 n=1 Tax=Ceratosolen solmsi marchali TaxID=326594 RepID=A0AAJ6VKL8_9HYME|nr:PREDICTED: uncharacterized protein LOC105359541 [Ceratosolen solmsi marchali]
MTDITTEFGPRKTVLILAIVAGCFAMLWPKIFYPMLRASVVPPHSTADSSGCCDVIFENDVTAIDIMQELCHNIIKHHDHVDPRVRDALYVSKFKKLTPSNMRLCKEEVLAKCGINLSSYSAEKEQLEKFYKQILEEIRGSNRSLCIESEFGVPLSRLGMPHLNRYHILMPHNNIKQERQTPPHAGSYHPALRERGRAIPSSHIVPRIQDRSDHLAPMKMRPPLGGAGHVVAAPKGNGSLGLLMPLYTIGIVIFFLYTMSKVLMGIVVPLYTIGNVLSLLYKIFQVLRKSTDNEIISSEYSTTDAEREYQKLVFNPDVFAAAVTAVNGTQDEQEETYTSSSTSTDPPPVIDELQEHQARKSIGLAAGVNPILKEPNLLEKPCSQDEKDCEDSHELSSTIKVVNMEMTTSCEGGVKCSRPSTPIIMPHGNAAEEKEKTPPISIYLEGALPPQCDLLVTDSKIQEIQEQENVEVPIVLSGKMTLSLINLDQESQENNLLESTIASETENNEKIFLSEINIITMEKLKGGEETEEIYERSSKEDDVESDKNIDDRYKNINKINNDKSLSGKRKNLESLQEKHNNKFNESITRDTDNVVNDNNVDNINDKNDADGDSKVHDNVYSVHDNSNNNKLSLNVEGMGEEVEEEDENEYELEYKNQKDRGNEHNEEGEKEYEKESKGEKEEIVNDSEDEIEEYEEESNDEEKEIQDEVEIENYEDDEEEDEEEIEEYEDEEVNEEEEESEGEEEEKDEDEGKEGNMIANGF